MKDLEKELRNSQDAIATLEEGKTFLLNENTILKNEAKVLKQNRMPNEGSGNNQLSPKTEPGTPNTRMSKELKSLRNELN